MMTVVNYLLTLAVLVTLMATLLYLTKAIKARSDKTEKNAYIKKSALFFLGYLVCNALRLYAQSGPK